MLHYYTKGQIKLFEVHCFAMFITALCVIFLMKLRWPKGYDAKNTSGKSVRLGYGPLKISEISA